MSCHERDRMEKEKRKGKKVFGPGREAPRWSRWRGAKSLNAAAAATLSVHLNCVYVSTCPKTPKWFDKE